jgi:hypothetical protein
MAASFSTERGAHLENQIVFRRFPDGPETAGMACWVQITAHRTTFEARTSMQGIMTFNSIASALRAGYQVCDRTQEGYLARIKTCHGWAMAVVLCK